MPLEVFTAYLQMGLQASLQAGPVHVYGLLAICKGWIQINPPYRS